MVHTHWGNYLELVIYHAGVFCSAQDSVFYAHNFTDWYTGWSSHVDSPGCIHVCRAFPYNYLCTLVVHT